MLMASQLNNYLLTDAHKTTEVSTSYFFFTTVQVFYLGLSKYLGSGWLYQKTKGTL